MAILASSFTMIQFSEYKRQNDGKFPFLKRCHLTYFTSHIYNEEVSRKYHTNSCIDFIVSVQYTNTVCTAVASCQ